MAQQETYGNWLGPERLRRQPGIYSVASKMSPMGDFRPASPDSFEDDYDDVSMAGSDRGPPGKGVYLLAGPPGSSRAPSLKDPEDLELKSPNPDPDPDPKSRNSVPKSRNFGNFWQGVAGLALLLALGALAWGGLLAAALGKHSEMRAELEQLKSNLSEIRDLDSEMRAELEQLKSNLSEIWDLVQQDQTRLQFGIHQHQRELQEVSEVLCRALGRSRRCGAGWLLHGSSCFSFSRRSLPWAGARSACADLGAHLATVGSEQEQGFLLEHRQHGVSYWLGLTKGEQEGTWSWVTGENSDFRFWDFLGKDPQKELKNCSTIGREGRWVNEHCWEQHRWICEKPGNC